MEILPGVHRIGTAISTVYLLMSGDSLTLVDTGTARMGRAILRYIQRIGHAPRDITRILLTHRHFDHMGSAAELRAATNATVWAHPLDIPQIDGHERNRPPKGWIGVVMTPLLPLISPFHPCPVGATLSDGQRIDLGNDLGALQVLHTPGHTMGHCSFYLSERGLLIAGDVLQHLRAVPNVSFDAVNDDTTLANETVVALPNRVSPEAIVFGHGAPILKNGDTALRQAARLAEITLERGSVAAP
jgi:glyoxylase-like metal-dependent hydrolase (beta-lactamase superfamily II)